MPQGHALPNGRRTMRNDSFSQSTMNRLPQPIEWKTEHLLAAIEYAAKKLFFSIDRKNMNRRPLTESLDDKIMGEVATIAVVEYLRSVGVPAASYDQFRLDGFKKPDPGWDILLGEDTYQWIKSEDKVKGRPETIKTASVKSSRLPKGDSLQTALQKRDFKIFAKPNQSIGQALTADIEMQIYFERDSSWLPDGACVTAEEVNGCIGARKNCAVVLEKLKIAERFGVCQLASWQESDRIVTQSAKLKQQQWTSYHAGSRKKMWAAPLRFGQGFASFEKGKLRNENSNTL